MLVIVLRFAVLGQARAQGNRGTANYMLPFCRTWLKVAAERDMAEVARNVPDTELMTAGMCAGVVVGIAETLRMFELACPPELVSYEPLVRTVVAEIEKHPEQLSEDSIVLASEVVMLSWACKK